MTALFDSRPSNLPRGVRNDEVGVSYYSMAEWHLAHIRAALARRGWQIAEHPGDDYRVSTSWEIRRARDPRALVIDFDGLDDMRALAIELRYGCTLRAATTSDLYFRRARRGDLWERELAVFVESLEG